MSLLLDALKQAEKQKNAEKSNDIEQQGQATDFEELSIDEPAFVESTKPVDEVDVSRQSLTSINEIQLEEVDEVKFESIIPPLSIASVATRAKKNQEVLTADITLDTSLNVFAVGNGQPRKPPHKKASAISVIIIAFFLLLVGMWYYLENESINEISDKILEDDPLFEEFKEQKQQKAKEVEASQSLIGVTKTTSSNNKNTEMVFKTDEQEVSPSISVETGIKIKKRVISTGIYSELDSAYQAFEVGNLGLAKSIYSEIIKSNPNQVDALLGLANIESIIGAAQNARVLYEKVLVQEQANTIAQLGLLQTYSDKVPLAKQQVLEELSSKDPNNVNILMALGQSYSEQSKWLKAQEVYFKGFSLQPTNVSVVYNLAVSLDQLGKTPVAITYYEKALSLNGNVSNRTDMSAITKRLQELREVK
jgi:tetratricopeptide (TPR) repeat protein